MIMAQAKNKHNNIAAAAAAAAPPHMINLCLLQCSSSPLKRRGVIEAHRPHRRTSMHAPDSTSKPAPFSAPEE